MRSLRQFPTYLLLPATAVVVVQANLNYVGCFSDPVGLVDMGSNIYQSRGLCTQRCRQIDQWVVGLTNGTRCLCGTRVPPTHYLVDDGECNSRCSGYAQEFCGGRGYFSVLVRDMELLQQQRAAESTDMSEKVPGNVRVGSY
ncbi:WSC-domain-containing protein [Apiospora arundinis]|uniref:WSC-domain-containing protein n=1 Tax=Apiospora arundinis TaxID=335852 RepID=A0ABR2I9G4_9PEZI